MNATILLSGASATLSAVCIALLLGQSEPQSSVLENDAAISVDRGPWNSDVMRRLDELGSSVGKLSAAFAEVSQRNAIERSPSSDVLSIVSRIQAIESTMNTLASEVRQRITANAAPPAERAIDTYAVKTVMDEITPERNLAEGKYFAWGPVAVYTTFGRPTSVVVGGAGRVEWQYSPGADSTRRLCFEFTDGVVTRVFSR